MTSVAYIKFGHKLEIPHIFTGPILACFVFLVYIHAKWLFDLKYIRSMETLEARPPVPPLYLPNHIPCFKRPPSTPGRDKEGLGGGAAALHKSLTLRRSYFALTNERVRRVCASHRRTNCYIQIRRTGSSRSRSLACSLSWRDDTASRGILCLAACISGWTETIVWWNSVGNEVRYGPAREGTVQTRQRRVWGKRKKIRKKNTQEPEGAERRRVARGRVGVRCNMRALA
jgi:hypothetical protein